MTTDLAHLDEQTREVMSRPVEDRLAWFQTEFWIKYERADAILDCLEGLINKPRRGRMPGFVVSADTNNGKSRIAARFHASHPMQTLEGDDCRIRMPVLLLQMMPNPSESVLLDAIMGALALPVRATDPIHEKRNAVVGALRDAEVLALCLDEIQMVLGARRENRGQLMDAIRYISNQVPVPIVAFSTPRGTAALASSDEMINRMRVLNLPVWPLNAKFQSLLATFEMRLPLPSPSGLSAPKFAALIYAKTEGYIGEVYDLLELALQAALAGKKPCLTIEAIRELDWAAPSDRKRAVKSHAG